MKINKVVQTSEPELPRIRLSVAEIQQVKESFIRENILLSFEEAGAILGKSTRHVQELVKDGKLILADEKAIKSGRKGASATAGGRVTAESLVNYRRAILVPPEKWKE